MASFGQYCPLAVAIETVGDRWSLLIVRDLLGGARGFNDLHRCLPRISRSVLSQRLRQLEASGIVERDDHGPGRTVLYRLTEAGAELEPILISLGGWAVRWTFGDPTPSQLDPDLLVYRMSEQLRVDRLPTGRTVVVELVLSRPAGRSWLVAGPHGATACRIDPGHQPDLVIRGDTADLQRWFLGREPFSAAVDAGRISVEGSDQLRRSFGDWFDPATPWHDAIAQLADRDRRH